MMITIQFVVYAADPLRRHEKKATTAGDDDLFWQNCAFGELCVCLCVSLCYIGGVVGLYYGVCACVQTLAGLE